MKKIFTNILVISSASTFLIIGIWYSTFVLIPKYKAAKIINEFEVTARNYNKNAIEEIVTKDSKLRTLPKEIYQEYFDKFHEGIVITSCIRRSKYILPSEKDSIWAEGKMKARLDGKYREHFEFLIKIEDGKWKLRQFSFPDFMDY